MENRTIFLHLGAHKTGTTFLQKAVMSHEVIRSTDRKETRFLSIHHADEDYLDFREAYTHIRNNLIFGDLQDVRFISKKVDQMSNLIQSYLSELTEGKIIWSDENLLGQTPGHFIGGDERAAHKMYPVSFCVAQAFANLTDNFSIYPRLYTRLINSFLESSYKDWLAKLIRADQKSDFLNRIDMETCDWGVIAAPWKKNFPNHFSSDTYESLRENKVQYIRDFAAWAQMEVIQLPIEEQGSKINQGVSEYKAEIIRATLSVLRDDDKAAFRRFLNQISH